MKRLNSYVVKTGLVATRQRMRLSQTELALELGVSRSLVALVELNKRSLPAAALIKMASLEIQLAGAGFSDQPAKHRAPVLEQPTEPGPMLAAPDMRAVFCRHRSIKLQQQLLAMADRYNSLNDDLHNFDQLIEVTEQAVENDSRLAEQLRLSFWQQRRAKVASQLNKCDAPAQASLRNKIALLNAEMLLHEGMQKQYNP